MGVLLRSAIFLALVGTFLQAQADDKCQRYYDGCGSCVADGVSGSLRHETDCSTHCDKVCGAQPADRAFVKTRSKKTAKKSKAAHAASAASQPPEAKP